MRTLAVISDPHANLPALEAALAAAEAAGADDVWCLGDLVGRGPHPEEVCELVRRDCSLVLAGNHDRVVTGRDPIWMLGGGIHSAVARWSNAVMTEETLAWLARLPSAAQSGPLGAFHGGPGDPAWQFIDTAEDARGALAATDSRLLLAGHTHVAAAHLARSGEIEQRAMDAGTTIALQEGRALLNPGAVGCGPLARFLMLDRERGIVSWHGVPYDVAATAGALEQAGFAGLAADLSR